MTHPRFSRREFLVGASSLPLLGFTPWLREGVYTQKATFTESEMIDLYIGNADRTHVPVEIRKIDETAEPAVWNKIVSVSPVQEHWTPGLDAGFEIAESIPASTLGVGFYEIVISDIFLRPENRINTFTQYQSENYIARFTVTRDFPGTLSNVLWVEDHLTEAAYSGFGELSLYGPQAGQARTVGWHRPGVHRNSLRNHKAIRHLVYNLTPLEYSNVAELSTKTLPDLPYELIILCGQLEYIPTALIDLLYSYVSAGGHLLVASNEFAAFRCRVDLQKGWMTSYKYDWGASDPRASDPDMSGIGMWSPTPEINLTGQSVFHAHSTDTTLKDLTLANASSAGWIWAGTGLSSGDPLPGVFKNFAMGSRIDTSGPEPVSTDSSAIIWGSHPVSGAKEWWNHDNVSFHESWPLFSSHATGTLNYIGNGWVVGYPGFHMMRDLINSRPDLQTILSNIVTAATT